MRQSICNHKVSPTLPNNPIPDSRPGSSRALSLNHRQSQRPAALDPDGRAPSSNFALPFLQLHPRAARLVRRPIFQSLPSLPTPGPVCAHALRPPAVAETASLLLPPAHPPARLISPAGRKLFEVTCCLYPLRPWTALPACANHHSPVAPSKTPLQDLACMWPSVKINSRGTSADRSEPQPHIDSPTVCLRR